MLLRSYRSLPPHYYVADVLKEKCTAVSFSCGLSSAIISVSGQKRLIGRALLEASFHFAHFLDKPNRFYKYIHSTTSREHLVRMIICLRWKPVDQKQLVNVSTTALNQSLHPHQQLILSPSAECEERASHLKIPSVLFPPSLKTSSDKVVRIQGRRRSGNLKFLN